MDYAGKSTSASEHVANELELAYGSASASQIDDSNDEDVAVETVGIEPIEDTSAAGKDAPSNAIPNKVEICTNVTPNTADTHNSNDG